MKHIIWIVILIMAPQIWAEAPDCKDANPGQVCQCTQDSVGAACVIEYDDDTSESGICTTLDDWPVCVLPEPVKSK